MVVLPCPGRSAGGEFASGVRRIRRCVVPSCVSCAGRAACTSVLPFLASNLIRFGMWLRHVCTCTYYLPKYRMYRTYRTCFQAPRTLRRLHMGRRRHTSTHVRHVLSPDICPLAIRPAHRCAPGSCAPLSRDPAILTGATAPRSRVTPATLPMLRTHHAMIPQRHAILARARCDGDTHTASAQHCGYVHTERWTRRREQTEAKSIPHVCTYMSEFTVGQLRYHSVCIRPTESIAVSCARRSALQRATNECSHPAHYPPTPTEQ